MVLLSTSVQLIKAVCTAEKQRVGFSHKKIQKSFNSATSFGSVTKGNTHRNHSSDHNKGIACRYAVASNRAQVVRSYTCVTTTQAIFPHPLSPAPIVIIERVSHLSHCIERLCPDTRFDQRKALTRFSCASRIPPPPCPRLETVCAAAPGCPASFCPSSRHHLPKCLFHLTPDRSTVSAVAACG